MTMRGSAQFRGWPGMTAERQYANATHHPASAIQHSLMAGHSRPKDGVLSHAYVPASQITDSHFKQPSSNSQTANQTAKRHHPYCLARPRVGPSSRCLPSKMRGMARQGAQPLFFVCPHSLSEIRGAARRATRTSLRTSGFICGRLPYGAGPRFSWPPVKHGTASVSQAPGGRLLLAARRSPGAARVRACEARPRAPHPIPPRMTPHESAPRWTGLDRTIFSTRIKVKRAVSAGGTDASRRRSSSGREIA